MEAQSLQLLLLTLFAIAGFFLFVVLIAFLDLDKLLLLHHRAVHVGKQQLQTKAAMAAAHAGQVQEPTAMAGIAAPNTEEDQDPFKGAASNIERVPLHLLQAATAHFSERHLLHAGRSADIFIASLYDDQLVSIKRFEPPPVTSPSFDPFFNELLTHASISQHFVDGGLANSTHLDSNLQRDLLYSLIHCHRTSSSSIAPPLHHHPCPHQHSPVDPLALPICAHPFLARSDIAPHRPSSLTSTSEATSTSIRTSSRPSTSSYHNIHTPCLNPQCICSPCHDQPQCPYLIPLLGYCLEEHMRLLVYEYMPNRDLATALKLCKQTWEAKHNCSSTMQIDNVNPSITPTLLSWFTRLKLAIQVAEALSFLHHSCQPPITHSFDARLSSFNEAHTLIEGELPLYDIHCYGFGFGGPLFSVPVDFEDEGIGAAGGLEGASGGSFCSLCFDLLEDCETGTSFLLWLEANEENKIEDEGDMSQATQQVLPTIDEDTPFHKGDAMSTQEVVEHESDFVAQKPSNDLNKGSENMLPTIEETQIREGNTRNSEEKMVVVENQSDVQTSPKPSDDMIIKDTYNMPLRDEEVEGSEKKDEANEEHQGALATTEVQDKVDKGTGKATRNANKAQSIQGRMQGTEGEEREIQERLRREEEEEERKILECLRREEEGEERKILERLRRQEEEEAQKKEEPAVHYKRPRRRKYINPYFMDEL
ncbi:hypothetical protein L7F22_050546 [Adiantum nelumboides]|nr:hypothetical protein [Adiantum nelumboides]